MGKQKKPLGKSYELEISALALQNIDEITGYIAFIDKNPKSAIKIGNKFFEKFDIIKENPFAYKECEEIPTRNKLYRKAICFSWHIIYKVAGKKIIILGIIHSSRKPINVKKLKFKK